MASIFAPPELFCAYAFAVPADAEGDPDLRKGTHLRVYAGLGASFPICPFAVFRAASRESEPRFVRTVDRDGNVVDGIDLGQHGVVETTLLLADDETRHTTRIDLEPTNGNLDSAALLDQRDRVIGERDQPEWMFGAPVLHKLRLQGDAWVGLRTRSIDLDGVLGLSEKDALGLLGLPVNGLHPWYVGVHSRDDCLQRVMNGAPLRLNPMDRAEGPFDAIGEGEEYDRVEAMLASAQFGGGLEQLVGNLVDDQGDPPWAQHELQELDPRGTTRQFANAGRLGALQTAAVDPGIARFLGFSDCYFDLPDLGGRGWDTVAVVGLFALAPRAFDAHGLQLGSAEGEPALGSDLLRDILLRTIAQQSGQDIRDEVEEVTAMARERGFVVAPCVALAAAVPPWLPPALPDPQIVQRRWQASDGATPSALYRAGFAFPHMPLAAMSALARATGGGPLKTRHALMQVGALLRAQPGIFGHEMEPNARLNEIGAKVKVQERAGLLADQDIPADTGPADFVARASDFFGRFGPPVKFGTEQPPRPAPPKPVLRFHIEPADVDPASTADLSPGTLRITVAVPRPAPGERFTEDEQKRLGPMIVVPRLDDLAAGSLALAALELHLGVDKQTVPLAGAGFFDASFTIRAIAPQAWGSWTLSGIFHDTANTPSEGAEATVTMVDRRPPKVYPSGIGLYWTSPPGPSPEVQLRLKWPALAHSRHRVYLTDQEGLGIADADLAAAAHGNEPSRGLVAAVGCKNVLGGRAGSRDRFTLITEPPIEAGDDGAALLDTRLPRSLATVQFLRVVPLGPDGAEPAFDTCGIVPVAVPENRSPPPPLLGGAVDPVTGIAMLTISTDGFNRTLLARDEPGLFDAALPGTEPPTFRIRRAVGPVSDPIYAGTIGRDVLALAEDDGTTALFTATFEDANGGSGLEPFVRYVYWADVRLPPERRLPADFAPLEPAGGVTSVDAAGRQSQPRPTSTPSAPRTLMHAPDLVAGPDPASVVTRAPSGAADIEVTVEIADPPRAHAKAVDRFRLAIWTQWQGGEIEPARNANGEDLAGNWPDIEDGVATIALTPPPGAGQQAPLTLRLAFVDPLGRMGSLTAIEVP